MEKAKNEGKNKIKERKVRDKEARQRDRKAIQRVRDPLTHPVTPPPTPMSCRRDACESETHLDLATQYPRQQDPLAAFASCLKPTCHRRSQVFTLIFSFKT